MCCGMLITYSPGFDRTYEGLKLARKKALSRTTGPGFDRTYEGLKQTVQPHTRFLSGEHFDRTYEGLKQQSTAEGMRRLNSRAWGYSGSRLG